MKEFKAGDRIIFRGEKGICLTDSIFRSYFTPSVLIKLDSNKYEWWIEISELIKDIENERH